MSEVPLREYIDAKIQALREYTETRILSIEKAVAVALEALEKRLAGMNEFRNQLRDQGTTFVTRNEHDIQIRKLEEQIRKYEDDIRILSEHDVQIRKLEEQIRKSEEDIRVLREYKATSEGKASQTSVIIAYILTIIALGLSIVNFLKE